MSTCNFGQPNLSKIYSIGLEAEEQYQFDDEYDNVIAALENIPGFQSYKSYRNNYSIIGCFTFNYYDREAREWDQIDLNVTVENGYYNGAMFDIEENPLDDIVNPSKTLQRQVAAKISRLEKTLARVTLPIIRVATFSNGEAWYERASNPRAQLLAIAKA